MKYAIIIMVILGVGCGYLSYRLGGSDCRKNTAEATNQEIATNKTIETQIEVRIMGTADADNLDWLLREYRRAD